MDIKVGSAYEEIRRNLSFLIRNDHHVIEVNDFFIPSICYFCCKHLKEPCKIISYRDGEKSYDRLFVDVSCYAHILAGEFDNF